MKGLLILVNYNQEQEIGRVLDKVARAHPVDQAVVVDDGSTDRSPEIARARGFRLLAHPGNQGVGAAIRTGLRTAQAEGYDYVVIMACNGKMDPKDIPALAGPILQGQADYVQGSRYLQGGGSIQLTAFRRVAIPLFSVAVSVLLRRRFTDATCGFRAYRVAVLSDPRMQLDQPWLDRYELEYYIHYWVCKGQYRIREVPVTMDYSHLESTRRSKIKPFSGWWSMVRPFVFLALGIKR
jgi:dolichol-phosphate mannosyltransferase